MVAAADDARGARVCGRANLAEMNGGKQRETRQKLPDCRGATFSRKQHPAHRICGGTLGHQPQQPQREAQAHPVEDCAESVVLRCGVTRRIDHRAQAVAQGDEERIDARVELPLGVAQAVVSFEE